jgi:hypothetical protein
MARLRLLLTRSVIAGALACLGLGNQAKADEQTVKLIKLLIQKGILSAGQAGELLRETVPAPAHGKHANAAPREVTVESAPPAAKPGEIRVTYVPQFVRKQIADEVRAQVMDEAKDEGWAEPDALPEWTKRFKLYGDLRVRYERDSFDQGNYGKFVNFAAINNGTPFDANNYGGGNFTQGNPPFLDTTEDRDRPRVRARIGVQALIDDGLTADIRISTGSDQGPVTPNQTLGQPGDFSKYSVYIDRANFSYTGIPGLTAYAGRFNNPFFATDLIFYSELGFDGLAASYVPKLTDNTDAFLTGGVFPILNSAFDFSTNSSTKFGSDNAYMLAIQGGGDWRVLPDLSAKLGVGFFDFTGIQGAVSKPCDPQLAGAYYCDTDNTRFPFQQFGNTVYAIRSIVQQPGATNPVNPQYYGLASKFSVLEVHPRIEITSYHPIDVILEGEFLKNLAYNQDAILRHGPVQGPIGPQNNIGDNGQYQGGDSGFLLKATVGNSVIHRRWDWNVTAAYKYLETDATLDSITDADFHLGGTNAQGYILTGGLGVARDTYLSLRYFAAQSISGPKYGNNVMQLDLLSSF